MPLLTLLDTTRVLNLLLLLVNVEYVIYYAAIVNKKQWKWNFLTFNYQWNLFIFFIE